MRKKNSVGVGKYQCRRRRRRRCRCWQKYVNILGLVLGLGLGLGLWLGLGLDIGVGVGVWQIRRRRFLRLISSSPQVVNVSGWLVQFCLEHLSQANERASPYCFFLRERCRSCVFFWSDFKLRFYRTKNRKCDTASYVHILYV